MYSMWIDNYFDVAKSLGGESLKKCIPFAFNINGKKAVTKFKIEELDMLTSTYKNEQEFINDLLKYGDKYIKRESNNPVIITHSKNGKTYLDDVIYNDKLIALSASFLRREKSKKKSEKRILLKNSEKMLNFIEYIKGLALNPETRVYLLDPDSLGEDVSYKDKKHLKKLVKDDTKTFLGLNNQNEPEYHIVKRGIRTLLSEYIKYSSIYKEKKENEEALISIEKDLLDISEQINLYFRNDYRNLRNMVAWENKYLEVLEKQLEKNDTIDNRYKLLPKIEEVNYQKKYRNDFIDKEMLNNFYDSLNYLVLNDTNNFIENEEIDTLFKEGGIEAVMENIDIDIIYGSSFNDAKKLGIVKKR